MSNDSTPRPKTQPGFGVPADAPKVADATGPTAAPRADGAPSPPAAEQRATEAKGGGSRSVRPPAADKSSRSRAMRHTPAVDIDLVYERRSAPLPDQPWVFLEVWTRNTIYQLDARLLCIDVIDQATRKSLDDHTLRGARLVGGQARDGESMELSHPFPRPGSEAVFEQVQGKAVRFSQTSTVTRVVMRLRVLAVTPEQAMPTWEEVSGQYKAI